MERERECQPVLPEAGVGGEGLHRDETVLGPQTDQDLEEAIRQAFFLDPDLDARRFTVRVVRGVAYLGGTARDEAEHQRALAVARGVQKIQRVVDEIACPACAERPA